jgi:hypothetical protein
MKKTIVFTPYCLSTDLYFKNNILLDKIINLKKNKNQ